MSAQIKEALSELEELRSLALRANDDTAFAYVAVREALEAAQQEAEAWAAIEAWRFSGDRTAMLCLVAIGNSKVFQLKDGPEALTKAATWCRAELAK